MNINSGPTAHGAFTLEAYLRRSAQQWPGRPAISDGVVTYSYRQVDDRADQVVNLLAARGVAQGDRVAILLSNRSEYLELVAGITRLGAIAVPLNFRLTAHELAYQFDNCTPAIVFVESPYVATAQTAVDATTHTPALVVVDEAGGAATYLDDVPVTPAAGVTLPEIGATDRFLIMYTSGTTGRPKGVVSTHEAYCVQAMTRIVVQGIPFGTGSAWLSGLQLFHLGGLASLIPSVLTGGHFVTVGMSVKEPLQVLDLLERHHVETCSLIPTQWEAILATRGIEDRHLGLKRISIGTMASGTDLFERVGKLAPGLALFNSFGQTETAGITASLSGVEAVSSPGSVGRPVMGVDLRIVDNELNEVPPGAVGEIVYQGPAVSKEYWNNPGETAKAWEGGWFHSGDLARRDERGLIWIVDRKKEMIISGGENIYPAELEQALAELDGIAEVAVIGLPDDKWGETPCAVVVGEGDKTPDEAAILAHLTTRLASYKKPKYVMYVQQLPHTATGKLARATVKQLALDMLRPDTH